MEILRGILLQQQADSARMPALSFQAERLAQGRKSNSKPARIEDTQPVIA
jgi:hypothetical protein